MILAGPEVKSAKGDHVSLTEAYVRLIEGKLWLINATITPYKFADNEAYDPTRTRQLLVRKSELKKITKELEGSNLTIVPTALYSKHGMVKLEIAIARGKKEFEKREKIKKRDLERETLGRLKGKLKI